MCWLVFVVAHDQFRLVYSRSKLVVPYPPETEGPLCFMYSL